MTDAPDGPDFIGEPGAVLADESMSRDDKIARLRQWRDALKSEAHDPDLNLESGSANRLIEIERALDRLGAAGA